jgi:death on curing protein
VARRWWYPHHGDVDRAISRLVERFGGRDLSGMTGRLRDAGLLEAALALPRQRYYVTTTDKAAALFRSMVKNHPFADGNKRIAVVITEVFLDQNGYDLNVENDQLAEFTLALASSDPPMPLAEVVRWLRAHTSTRR